MKKNIVNNKTIAIIFTSLSISSFANSSTNNEDMLAIEPNNTATINMETYVEDSKLIEKIENAISIAESTLDKDDYKVANDLINQLSESDFKKEFLERLKIISLNLATDTATANLDLYITFENALFISIDNNYVTFTDFSGTEDIERKNALNISVGSTLPYQLNAYLEAEIQNTDKSITLNKEIFNIKEGSDNSYRYFKNTKEKMVLKDNNLPTDNTIHPIDLMLKGGFTYKTDVYKTIVKFEIEQK